MKLTINIDGGSRGNPGPAAYGCYIQGAGPQPLRLKGRLGTATNNVAEYHGLIRALEKAVELHADEVQILADSELLVRQMTGVYKVKNEQIAVLYRLAKDLIEQIGKVHFRHVYREQNSAADALCNEALDDPGMPIEKLGLSAVKSVSTPTAPVKVTKKVETSSPVKEVARVKLVGSLLRLTQLGGTSYGVVVKGITWRLALARIPSDVQVGDHVTVTGELTFVKEPVIKVKKISKA